MAALYFGLAALFTTAAGCDFFHLLYVYIFLLLLHYQLMFAFCGPHLLQWLFTSKNKLTIVAALWTFSFTGEESQRGTKPGIWAVQSLCANLKMFYPPVCAKKGTSPRRTPKFPCHFFLTFNTQDTISALTISKLLYFFGVKHLPSN